MDPKNCSKSTNFYENPSDIVHEADEKGHTNDSVSKNMLIEEQDVNKVQQGKGNDARMAKDVVRCSNISIQAAHEEVITNCHVAESDTSKAKGKEFHLVDLSGRGESENDQRICRICHLGSDESPAVDRVSGKPVSPDLIEIGCKCKNELGLAHSHCAEAWFQLRGNSVCEICGCAAKNVTVRLMEEEWNEEREITLDERRVKLCCIIMAFMLAILFFQWFYANMVGDYYNEDT